MDAILILLVFKVFDETAGNGSYAWKATVTSITMD